ncbi:DUF5684 domain-containing protein [Microbacterium elymi]|uniref:DUF5684 domain-containing protein n=1 Tax=Microbacterium elymi TaxID=2909587 RepID=A0ABY5NL81_9MICO|nr:DUF5684 domain-containing protein [Microbacterium elymi]UUT35917.1 DUF5684 domain-containing protein [Microbacterium elymi]
MNDSAIAAAVGSVLISLLIAAAFYVWVALALQAVFRKTGEEGGRPGCRSSTASRCELGGVSGWWMLLLLFPPAAIVVYVFLIIACHRLNVGFGYGAGMTVLAALLFPVWASVVGWSANRWIGASPAAAHRAGPVRTGAPAPAHGVPPRPQALAWRSEPAGGAGAASSGFAPAPSGGGSLPGPAAAAGSAAGVGAPPRCRRLLRPSRRR